MRLRSLLCAVACIACQRTDPVLRERIVERDQLRREVRGFRSLEADAPGKLMDRGHDVLISISDTLLRSLIDRSLPITVPIRDGVTVTLQHTTVAFRANVARVEITGEVRRLHFPSVAAAVRLRGALDRFTVDSTHVLSSHVTIDDVSLDTPTGAPDALAPLVISVLQRIVEGSLPEVSAGLPALIVPVRLDRRMELPGFGPEGMLSIAPSSAPMRVQAKRVIAFQNRLWIVLGVHVGAFASADSAPR